MKKFNIWSEGYRATGDWADAQFHGLSEGDSFEQACIRFAKENAWFDKWFHPEKMTFWGCKLYDNEVDARKRFG